MCSGARSYRLRSEDETVRFVRCSKTTIVSEIVCLCAFEMQAIEMQRSKNDCYDAKKRIGELESVIITCWNDHVHSERLHTQGLSLTIGGGVGVMQVGAKNDERPNRTHMRVIIVDQTRIGSYRRHQSCVSILLLLNAYMPAANTCCSSQITKSERNQKPKSTKNYNDRGACRERKEKLGRIRRAPQYSCRLRMRALT